MEIYSDREIELFFCKQARLKSEIAVKRDCLVSDVFFGWMVIGGPGGGSGAPATGSRSDLPRFRPNSKSTLGPPKLTSTRQDIKQAKQ